MLTLKSVYLAILEQLALNAQKCMGSHSPDLNVLNFFSLRCRDFPEGILAKCEDRIFSRVSELLAFNAQKFVVSSLATPSFTFFGIQGLAATERHRKLRIAIIGPHTSSEKCFDTPIENAW